MKTALALAMTLAAATTSATGAAADARADIVDGIGSAAVSTLPTGRATVPPKGKWPAMIRGSEKAPGFAIASQPNGRHFADFIVVAANAQRAKDFSRGEQAAGDVCFSEGERPREDDDDDDIQWQPMMRPLVMMASAVRQGERPPVEALHSEHLATGAGGTTLEMTDAWVDPVTRGARIIDRSSLPLLKITTVLGGGVVYAGRDSHGVHVVLTTTPRGGANTGVQLFAVIGGNVFTSECDHLHVRLKAEKGNGASASFVETVRLAQLGDEPAPDPKAPRANRSVRSRPLHLNASVSWASRDTDALLSVSSGWESRERSDGFF